MTTYVFSPPARPSLPVAGHTDRFPVRRIFCVGRNYAAHAREMGHDPDRDPPFFFGKPADTLVEDGAALPYPAQTNNLHHEAELVVAIGTGGRDIATDSALSHVWGYAVGNDLTRRDLQAEAKNKGRPWDMAKGFDQSAVCGMIHPVDMVGHIADSRITLSVNDTVRQDADVADMIWPVPDIVAFLSASVALQPGDLIFTGTPDGVGPLEPGDHCVVTLEGLGQVATRITARR